MNEFIARFFGSVGEVKEVYTVVDFYQYIKTVEYLICVAFFVGFPLFYKHVIKSRDSVESRSH